MSRRKTIALLAAALSLVLAAPAFAGKGGRRVDPPCTISGTTVSATGLPTDQVINFMVVDNSTGGVTGWVLGYTRDGTFTVNVPAPSGSTTYQFTSRTWGNDGSKWTVFSSCST